MLRNKTEKDHHKDWRPTSNKSPSRFSRQISTAEVKINDEKRNQNKKTKLQEKMQSQTDRWRHCVFPALTPAHLNGQAVL